VRAFGWDSRCSRGGAGQTCTPLCPHLPAHAPRERPNPDRFSQALQRPLKEQNEETIEMGFRRLHLKDLRDVEGQVMFYRSQDWMHPPWCMRRPGQSTVGA
jgi:hypothetical protein